MKTVDKVSVHSRDTLRAALENINASGLQIAFVIDTDQRLIGTISDGDIRRGLLRGLTLDAPVDECANAEPHFARVTDSDEAVLGLLKRFHLHQMPLLDADGRLVGLKLFDDLVEQPLQPNLVVLMVGGLGSRLGKLTKTTPKPMLPVGGKPLLETIVENFRTQGFHRFRFAVNHLADKIEDHFGDGSGFGCEIGYLREEQRMGTAGALSLLSERSSDPVIVSNGDLLLRLDARSLLRYHQNSGAAATMAVREFEYQVPYGVVIMDGEHIVRIDEKPVQRHLIAGGIYALSPEAVAMVPDGRFFDMPDLFRAIIEQGGRTCSFGMDGYWLDIGRSSDYEQAQREFPHFLASR